MKHDVTQIEINDVMMKIMAEQTKQIKLLRKGLQDLNKRLKELERINPQSFL